MSTGAALAPFSFGTGTWPNTVPVTGDWDGDGVDGIGTYTLSTGVWNLRNTATAGTADIAPFLFWSGSSASYPVVGDWNADGIDTVGVKASTTWLLNDENDSGVPDYAFTFGLASDLPMSWTPATAPPIPG